MFMDDIKRSNIRNTSTTAEIITSYEWDFRFTKLPDQWGDPTQQERYLNLFRVRTMSVITPPEPQNIPVSVDIRLHHFSQPGASVNYGTFQFTLQDFADTGIQKSLMQLQYAMSDPETKAMNDAATRFFFDCELYQLDSKRQLIKKWICKDCLLSEAQVVDNMDSAKQPIGQTTVTFTTDLYTIEYPKTPSRNENTSTEYISGKSIKNTSSR